MLKYVVVDGKRIREGTILIAKEGAEQSFGCKTGTSLSVRSVGVVRGIIGVESKRRIPDWGDLDGTVGNRKGLWILISEMVGKFSITEEKYRVDVDFEFAGRNLRGKECKIISNTHNPAIVAVEFSENVNGGSADGIGKKGHCLIMDLNLLRSEVNDETVDSGSRGVNTARPVAPCSIVTGSWVLGSTSS